MILLPTPSSPEKESVIVKLVEEEESVIVKLVWKTTASNDV
jgi:hypothetical protein